MQLNSPKIMEMSGGSFFGSDWLGMAGNLIGLWFLSKQNKRGFIFGSVGCVGWMAFGFITGSVPSIVSNIVYIGMNIHGWRKWKKKPPQNNE